MSLNMNGKYPCTLGIGCLDEVTNDCELKGALFFVIKAYVEGYPELDASLMLVDEKGTLKAQNIKDLIRLFNGKWDGTDIAALDGIDAEGVACEVFCKDGKPNKDGKVFTKAYLNIPFGGSSLQREKVDAKSLASRFNGQLRALAKSGTTKPATATKPTAPSAPPAKSSPPPPSRTPPPPAKPAATSSLNDCWTALTKKEADLSFPDNWANDWWTANVVGDIDKWTPEQWGEVMVKIEAIVAPF